MILLIVAAEGRCERLANHAAPVTLKPVQRADGLIWTSAATTALGTAGDERASSGSQLHCRRGAKHHSARVMRSARPAKRAWIGDNGYPAAPEFRELHGRRITLSLEGHAAALIRWPFCAADRVARRKIALANSPGAAGKCRSRGNLRIRGNYFRRPWQNLGTISNEAPFSAPQTIRRQRSIALDQRRSFRPQRLTAFRQPGSSLPQRSTAFPRPGNCAACVKTPSRRTKTSSPEKKSHDKTMAKGEVTLRNLRTCPGKGYSEGRFTDVGRPMCCIEPQNPRELCSFGNRTASNDVAHRRNGDSEAQIPSEALENAALAALNSRATRGIGAS
jgi:hypothetical protein